uniref:Cathepsin B-like cysteine proteinase 6 n=1 Tax=Cacopsylla melanoneura TaxID=428564 RepID=A0A8D8VCC3_9HEMI
MVTISPAVLQTAFNPIILTTIASFGIVTSYLAYNHYHRVADNSTVGTDFNTDSSSSIDTDSHEDTLNRYYPDIPIISHSDYTQDIPEAFDARQEWPQCKELIGKVWNQGSCQSCWAISAASVMTDRICIQSNGTSKPILSPQHLICSCTNCTRENFLKEQAMQICRGGDSESAWEYWKQSGLVSGGDYGTNESCLPYLSPPCIHNPAQPRTGLDRCPRTISPFKCPNNTFDSEKKYVGSEIYYVKNNTLDIQKEILQFGSVQAKHVFERQKFLFYQNGLYKCSPTVDEKSEEHYIHSVKIIGWNKTEEKGEPYWLCVNSFGTEWGEQGLFRIPRGTNMCLVEDSVMGGTPSQDSQTTTTKSK